VISMAHTTYLYLFTVIPTLMFLVSWFAIAMVVFGPLHWLFRAQTQPFWRSDFKTDLAYWFLSPFFCGYIAFIARAYTVDHTHIDHVIADATRSLASLPIPVQCLIILIATDLIQYWGHRLFHLHPLWRFHCIHHAPTTVDWLTGARFHPINFILYASLINMLVAFAAFTPTAFFALVPFNILFNLLVHANLNWTFGPFRYVLASPVFHRWHHTHPEEGGNRNFAPTFPVLDLIFGTFYMPKDRVPSVFGTPYDPVPTKLMGQLWYPFRRLGRR
jgi:sterol desaturase/sphingolipid hydroxylase (fatty acid hydroxylase superfamily)